MTFPYMILFSSSLMISTIMILSSSHWLLMWASLELNLLSFIPLISLSSMFQETESSIKYFLAQALGSSVLVTTALSNFYLSPMTQTINYYFMMFMILSLLLKLGVAPLHFWFPSVLAGLSWPMAFMLSSWQKIGPIFILSTFMLNTSFMLLSYVAIISALVGGFGGLNQTNLRPLLAYSSIGHLGWMMAGLIYTSNLMMTYFMFYLLLITPIFIILWKNNLFSTQFTTAPLFLTNLKWLSILFLSLSGIPPLLGFFPKWFVIMSLVESFSFSTLILLISGSLMNIFYYLAILLAIFYSSSYTINLANKFYPCNQFISLSTMCSLSAIFLTPMAVILY